MKHIEQTQIIINLVNKSVSRETIVYKKHADNSNAAVCMLKSLFIILPDKWFPRLLWFLILEYREFPFYLLSTDFCLK